MRTTRVQCSYARYKSKKLKTHFGFVETHRDTTTAFDQRPRRYYTCSELYDNVPIAAVQVSCTQTRRCRCVLKSSTRTVAVQPVQARGDYVDIALLYLLLNYRFTTTGRYYTLLYANTTTTLYDRFMYYNIVVYTIIYSIIYM